VPAHAQDTRAAQIAGAQAQKAATVEPPRRGWLEKTLGGLRERGDRIAPPIGFFPWFGSVYSGGAIAAGPGLRIPFGDTGEIKAYAGWSVRNYKAVTGEVTFPAVWRGRVQVTTRGRWVDAPTVPFYGLGNDSNDSDRTNLGLRPIEAMADVVVRPLPWLSVGGGADFLKFDTRRGGGSEPSVDEVYSPSALPGLGADPTLLRSFVHVGIDTRPDPGYARRGSVLRIEASQFTDLDSEGYDFRSYQIKAAQLVPVLNEHWVLALRGHLWTTDTRDGHAVPFFLLPYLGGSDELRSFSTLRFRDNHALFLSAEWRWPVTEMMDMAVFVDAGKVAATRGDLTLTGLTTSWGLGATFHTLRHTLVRLEAAHGRDGFRFVFGVGPTF